VNGKAGLPVRVIVGTVSVIPNYLLLYKLKLKLKLQTTTLKPVSIFTFRNNRQNLDEILVLRNLMVIPITGTIHVMLGGR
jgi:hypothetical protein